MSCESDFQQGSIAFCPTGNVSIHYRKYKKNESVEYLDRVFKLRRFLPFLWSYELFFYDEFDYHSVCIILQMEFAPKAPKNNIYYNVQE